MIGGKLDTFIKTADAKSFNKAAEVLYVTPPAVIKQINRLEGELGVRLFKRNHQGLTLTAAGQSFYKDAVYLLGYIRDAEKRARDAQGSRVIRVGVSPMTPIQPVMQLWSLVYHEMPDIRIMVVPFENTEENAREILLHLGDRIDVVPGIFDSTLLKFRRCQGMELEKVPLSIAVSYRNPLAAKDKLTFDDLKGQTLFMMREGWSSAVDALRQDCMENHPDIHIQTFPFYDVTIFNRCENNEAILLAVDTWKYVHPLLKIIPVDWPYTISFGMLYSNNPTPLVKDFLQNIKLAAIKRIESEME
jgi:DNA-binding transcriptional LysR family regulator